MVSPRKMIYTCLFFHIELLVYPKARGYIPFPQVPQGPDNLSTTAPHLEAGACHRVLTANICRDRKGQPQVICTKLTP